LCHKVKPDANAPTGTRTRIATLLRRAAVKFAQQAAKKQELEEEKRTEEDAQMMISGTKNNMSMQSMIQNESDNSDNSDFVMIQNDSGTSGSNLASALNQILEDTEVSTISKA
jgi:hypothetical protein